jgi:hypothetical protein
MLLLHTRHRRVCFEAVQLMQSIEGLNRGIFGVQW